MDDDLQAYFLTLYPIQPEKVQEYQKAGVDRH
jgi:hypothetical protein